MALNQLIMSYVLRKVNNPLSKVQNRWFAYVNSNGTITARGLAEYLQSLGVLIDRPELEKVILRLAQAIPELVAQGYGVQLPGLGIFYATIANFKGGAASPQSYNVASNIEGVRFRFRPDSTDLDDLTSRTFGKKVSFGNGYYQKEDGPKAPLIPLAAAKDDPDVQPVQPEQPEP